MDRDPMLVMAERTHAVNSLLSLTGKFFAKATDLKNAEDIYAPSAELTDGGGMPLGIRLQTPIYVDQILRI